MYVSAWTWRLSQLSLQRDQLLPKMAWLWDLLSVSCCIFPLLNNADNTHNSKFLGQLEALSSDDEKCVSKNVFLKLMLTGSTNKKQPGRIHFSCTLTLVTDYYPNINKMSYKLKKQPIPNHCLSYPLLKPRPPPPPPLLPKEKRVVLRNLGIENSQIPNHCLSSPPLPPKLPTPHPKKKRVVLRNLGLENSQIPNHCLSYPYPPPHPKKEKSDFEKSGKIQHTKKHTTQNPKQKRMEQYKWKQNKTKTCI